MGLFSRIKSFFTKESEPIMSTTPELQAQQSFPSGGGYAGGIEAHRTPSGYVPPPIGSGGGGRGIDIIPTGSIEEELRKQEELKQDIISGQQKPLTIQEVSKRPISIVEETKDITIGESLGRIKTISQQEGVKEAIFKTPKLLFAAITKPEERRKLRLEREKRDIELAGERVVISQEDIQKGIRGEGGTVTSFRIEKTSDAVLLRDTRLGDVPSERAYVEKKDKENEVFVTNLNSEYLSRDIKLQNANDKKIQDRINSGDITLAIGQKQSKTFASNLDKIRSGQIESEAKLRIDKQQEIINAAAKKGEITRIILGTATALVAGIVTGAVLGAAPALVSRAASIGGGLLFASETSKLGQEVVTGKAGVSEVVSFGVQSTAFLAGAKIGSKRSISEQTKLEGAISRSRLEIKSKGLINENKLSLLDIPSSNRIELKARLDAGQSLKKLEVKLIPKSTTDQTLINKELPYRKVEFIEITDRFGRVIDRVAIGRITLKGRTGKVFKQDIISKSEAFVTPEGIESETLTLLGKEGKGVEKAILTAETTKGILIKKGKLRLVKTKTGVRLVEAIEAKGRPLTEKQLRDLTLSRGGERGKPISETQFEELQRKTKLRIDAVFAGKKILGVKRERLIAEGIGISGGILTVPTPKGKVPKTPFRKTFALERKPTGKTFQDIQKGVRSKIKKIQEQVEKITPKFDVPSQIGVGVKESLKKGVRQVQAQRPLQIAIPSAKQSQKTLQQLQVKPSVLNEQFLKDLNLQSNLFNQQMQQLQKQFLQPQQQLKQQLQVPQLQISTITPTTPIIPIIPILPFDFRGDVDKTLKKLNERLKKSSERQASYAASLSNVFFQKKPIAISKEKFKELTEKEFLGFEQRPVLVLKPRKKSGKKKKR
ncbi:hypothetical protein LCGC14_0732180 [marine sediment metagenome]|uniref:Uncharacterized protein n=1 Tax=marine sediment metagenome TaxID=412755 RepID=A0A0F9QUA3_9ZZZZ